MEQVVNNPKGQTFPERFIDVMSDPSNLLIPRVPRAGHVDRGWVTLHNGLEVLLNGYYGSFTQILIMNKGVHEPSEERMFAEVLTHIRPGGVMIELGSYWAFYTMWFRQVVPEAHNYCIEPNYLNLQVGIRNCQHNHLDASVDFTQAVVDHQHLHVSDFANQKKITQIDLLHSDIQGAELEMLTDMIPLLDQKKIHYLFISTHSDQLHADCLRLLQQHQYRIIAQADYEHETFCFDGIIVACPTDDQTLPYTSLGCRQTTPLRTEPYPNLPRRE